MYWASPWEIPEKFPPSVTQALTKKPPLSKLRASTDNVALIPYAQVVKLVDTLASGASGLTAVEVQVLSWAPLLPGSTP